MGDLLNKLESAAEGRPYTGDVLQLSGHADTSTNQTMTDVLLGNPSVLQHSYNGQSVMSRPSVLTADDHSKGNGEE